MGVGTNMQFSGGFIPLSVSYEKFCDLSIACVSGPFWLRPRRSPISPTVCLCISDRIPLF